MQKLYDKIEKTLETYPETRNSDIALMIKVWKNFHGVEDSVKLEKLYDLPTHESVKRLRARIQNDENRFLPTSEKVRKQRSILEERWKTYLGYSTMTPELHKEVGEQGLMFSRRMVGL